MKKTLSILLVLILAFAAFAVSALALDAPAEEPEEAAIVEEEAFVGLTGGWSAAESQEITEEIQALVDTATEKLLGVDYVPVAYLGSQLVAGTNHCILCKAAAVVPDAEAYFALVYLYEDLEGNVEVLDIQVLDIGGLMYSGGEE